MKNIRKYVNRVITVFVAANILLPVGDTVCYEH